MTESVKADTAACKAALCLEIREELGFDPSNAPFAPPLSADAEAAFARLCAGACETCPILAAAAAMRKQRLQ